MRSRNPAPQPSDAHTPASPPHATASIPQCPPSACLPRSVRVVEVGPRDGLQNEAVQLDTSTKVSLVHDLVDAGLRTVEVTAFVSAKWVPQLSDAALLMTSIRKQAGVEYPVLVPNMKGLQAALDAHVSHIAVFASATEAFSRHNINCTIRESLDRYARVVAVALARRVKVRAYVSCVAGCPYEGDVDPHAVARVAKQLYSMGCFEVSLGDTIGIGNPRSIVRVVDAVVAAGVPVSAVAIHCHDTRGTALANVLAAMSRGVAVVDSSVGGLGGCPFAPGAAGNLATEDLVHMLQGMHIDIGGIDLDKVVAVGKRICRYLKRQPTSRMACATNTGAAPDSASGEASSSSAGTASQLQCKTSQVRVDAGGHHDATT